MRRCGVWSALFALAATLALAACAPLIKEIKEIPLERGVGAEPLHIHVLAHSHCDVGWLETIEGYYQDYVKNTINNAVAHLAADPKKKFIWVEQAFFTRWWQDATALQKEQVRSIVKSKQLEFVMGGWVMQDEALTTYSADIDQMTHGHRFLTDTFDYHPTTGYQIDPFGASSETPVMYSQMGLTGLIINRMHYDTLADLKAQKKLEFVWRGSPSLQSKAEMFTHVFDAHYCSPSGFDFDGDPKTNPPITPESVELRAIFYVGIAAARAYNYRHNHILIPFGCDFLFHNASKREFEQMDMLMEYINSHPLLNAEIHYTTLSEYFDVVHNLGITWPTYEGDFTPYADNPDSYWTGYYTSRNELKGTARSSEAVLRDADTLYSVGRSKFPIPRVPLFTPIDSLRSAMGEVQHHDGITGTERQEVVDMYLDHMKAGVVGSNGAMTSLVGWIVGDGSQPPAFPYVNASDLRETLKSGGSATILLSNSLGWSRSSFPFKTLVTRTDLAVSDWSGKPIACQIVPLYEADGYELFFPAYVTPLGLTKYVVSTGQAVCELSTVVTNPTADFSIGNGAIQLNFRNRMLLSATLPRSGTTIDTSLGYLQYESYNGSAPLKGQASGAYIFRPYGQEATPIRNDKSPCFTSVMKGSLVERVYQRWYGSGCSVSEEPGQFAVDLTVVKTFASGDVRAQFVDVVHHLGALGGNKEAVCRWSTSIANDRKIWTDSNGVEMRERTFNSNTSQPVAANFYSTVMTSFIRDGRVQLTALSPQAHGVASLHNGEFESMLHRRCMQDDHRGLARPLDEMARLHERIRFILGTMEITRQIRRQLGFDVQFPLSGMVVPSSAISKKFPGIFAPIKDLPDNVHLLSFKARDGSSDSIILRLHHIFELNEDPKLSQPVIVDLDALFGTFKIGSLQERKLSMDRDVTYTALEWETVADASRRKVGSKKTAEEDKLLASHQVSLQPMEIRSFYMSMSG